MAEAQSKLFHAIVGLGLAAAGCGARTFLSSADAGRNQPHLGVTDAGSRDAHTGTPDVAATQDSAPSLDAAVTIDAAPPPHDAGIDAEDARDAAVDVGMPPPPPPVK